MGSRHQEGAVRMRLLAGAGAFLFVVGLGAQQSIAPDFVPDLTFKGSQLTNWHPVGTGSWKAENGVIVGTADANAAWLMFDRSYQDVAFYAKVRCSATCDAGVLFRSETNAEGSKGVLVSLADTKRGTFKIAFDSNGRELSREPLAAAGGFIRIAGVAPGGRGGIGAAAGPGGPAGAPGAAPTGRGGRGPGDASPGAQAGPSLGRGRAASLPVPLPALNPPVAGMRLGAWNDVSVILDANVLRPFVNNTTLIAPGDTGDSSNGYGPIALYVGSGAVEFKDVSFKNLNGRVLPAERTGARFRMQRIDDFYYAWSAAVADVNRDGNLDVVAGPYYYEGPTFTQRREIYLGQTVSPSTGFSSDMVNFAYDFTGDGWPDVLSCESRPLVLYVNPKGELRRWARYPVLPTVSSEIALMKDIDADGTPEILFSSGGAVSYAKPDPSDATKPLSVHAISAAGLAYGHSLGVGDINGDGRMDVLQTAGWWEQPPTGASGNTWNYHPQAFGRWNRSEGAGGGEIAVYDVNGDKLNDVVTSLTAHDWGLAWFEQKRDSTGAISFVQHMIMDNFATKNAGDVTFAEMHAAASADIDGDGIPDFITGKRFWSHLDTYSDPDPYGAPVLYWFRTVRNPKAPGGAEFVPELIHNRSGVGSAFATADLNRDGAVDIVTSTDRGTFIFYGTARVSGRGARTGQ